MENNNPINPDQMLTNLGFVKEGESNIWIWSGKKADTSTKHDEYPDPDSIINKPSNWSVFSIIDWKIELSEEKIDSEIRLEIDQKTMITRLESEAKKLFGNEVIPQIVVGNLGEVWCLFEFQKNVPSSDDNEVKSFKKSIPVGLAGFRFQIVSSGRAIRITISDHFTLGYFPSLFISVPPKYLANALGVWESQNLFSQQIFDSLYEFSFDIEAAAISSLAKGPRPQIDQNLKSLADKIRFSKKDANIATSFKEDKWHLSNKSADWIDSFTKKLKIPLEVLESRESIQELKSIDQLILSEQYDAALTHCNEQISTSSNYVFIIRRLAFLGVTDIEHSYNAEILNYLENEPKNKLLLSHALSISLKEDKNTDSLNFLSKLGETLIEDGVNVDQLTCFDIVMPELLGDCWTEEDNEIAVSCYQRILDKRGDEARILRKVIKILQIEEKGNDEVKLLNRLISIETRNSESAKIYLRLAELAEKEKNYEKSISMSLKALQLDRCLYQAALHVADLLCKINRDDEAIELLGDLVRNDDLNISDESKAKLECHIATIWQEFHNRNDLAAARFESALAFDSNNTTARKNLEDIYKANGQYDKFVQLLQSQFDRIEKNSDQESIWLLFNELYNIYKNKIVDNTSATKTLERFLSTIDPLFIHNRELLNFTNENINWNNFFDRFSNSIANKEDPREKAQALSLLGHLKLKVDNDNNDAIHHLLSAINLGYIGEKEFELLCYELEKNKKFNDLVICLQWKLNSSTPENKIEIINKLLNFHEHIPNKVYDDLLIRAFLFDSSNIGLITDRLNIYLAKNEIDDGAKLVNLLNKEEISLKVKIIIIEYWIGLIVKSDWELKYKELSKLFYLLLKLPGNESSTLQKAISHLKETDNYDYIIDFIIRLLKKGEIPKLDQNKILEILANNKDALSIYYELQSEKSTDRLQASAWARKSLEYINEQTESQRFEKLLSRIASLSTCSQKNLDKLKEMVNQSNRWNYYIEALLGQIKYSNKNKEKRKHKEELADIYRYKTNEPQLARLVYESLLNDTENVSKVLLQLADIGNEIEDLNLSMQSLTDLITDPNSLKNIEQLCDAITRYQSASSLPTNIIHQLISYLGILSKNNQFKEAKILANCLNDNSIKHPGISIILFQIDIINNQQEDSIVKWTNGGLNCSSPQLAIEYIKESENFLTDHGNFDKFHLFLENLYTNENFSELSIEVQSEFIYSYAINLFDNPNRVNEALNVFRRYSELNPHDSRAWIPQYFILREINLSSERKDLIERILPAIRNNPSILDPYPLTIESLEKELRQLRWNFDTEVKTGIQTQESTTSIDGLKTIVSTLKQSPAGNKKSPGSIFEISHDMDYINTNNSIQKTLVNRKTKVVNIFKNTEESATLLTPNITKTAAGYEHFSIPTHQSAFMIEKEENLRKILLESITDDDLETENPSISLSMNTNIGLSGTSDNLTDASNLEKFDETKPQTLQKTELVYPQSAVSGIINLDSEAESELHKIELEPIKQITLEESSIYENNSIDRVSDKVSNHIPLPESLEEIEESNTFNNDHNERESITPSQNEIGVFSLTMVHSDFKTSDPNINKVQNRKDAELDADINETYSYLNLDNLQEDSDEKIHEDNAQRINIYNKDDLPPVIPPYEADVLTSDNPNEDDIENIEDIKHYLPSYSSQPNLSQALDWKSMISNPETSASAFDTILENKTLSDVDKHIALQISAIKTDSIQKLDSWKWQSWRNLETCEYSLSGSDRYPYGELSDIFRSPIYKLIMAIVPVMIQVYKNRFTHANILNFMKINASDFERKLKLISWEDPILKRSGLYLFKEVFITQKQKIFSLNGLGKNIFFDAIKRIYFFDHTYYEKVPPSHLLHRMLSLSWAIRKQFFAPLQLNIHTEVITLMREIEKIYFSTGTNKIKKIIGVSTTPIEKLVQSSNPLGIENAYRLVGPVSESSLTRLWYEMNLVTQQLQLSDTMDLVGLCESILDLDLTKKSIDQSVIVNSNKNINDLIKFALLLNNNSN
ncbi:MAG: hypothetical protein R3B45_07495 [Bdellovibrionota bacterium]